MESWRNLWDGHLAPSAITSTWKEFVDAYRSTVDRAELCAFVAKKNHAEDLARHDSTAVLNLRDWICERVALSRRKAPLSPAEIRSCMDGLRAAAPAERAALALKYACEKAGDCPEADAEVDALLIQRWLSNPCTRTSMAPPALLDFVAQHSLRVRATTEETIQSLSKAAQVSTLDTLRLVLDAKTKLPCDLVSLYAELDSAGPWIGAVRLSSDRPLRALPAPSAGSVLPPLDEMALVCQDGYIRQGPTAIRPSRACHELGFMVAACDVPLSDSVVAIHQDAKSRRHLALWTLADPESYAILDELTVDAEHHDHVDVQLTQDGDLLVQSCRRGEDGAEAAPAATHCVRMVEGDVSSLHHVDLDDAGTELLLQRRKESGIINHMDHGNLLALERLSKNQTWYAGLAVPLPASINRPVALWGNPFRVYVWESTGGVVECALRDGAWCEVRREQGAPFAGVVCAIHLLKKTH